MSNAVPPGKPAIHSGWMGSGLWFNIDPELRAGMIRGPRSGTSGVARFPVRVDGSKERGSPRPSPGPWRLIDRENGA